MFRRFRVYFTHHSVFAPSLSAVSCVTNQPTRYHGSLDAATLVRNVLATTQTGDLHAAVYDLSANLMVWLRACLSVNERECMNVYACSCFARLHLAPTLICLFVVPYTTYQSPKHQTFYLKTSKTTRFPLHTQPRTRILSKPSRNPPRFRQHVSFARRSTDPVTEPRFAYQRQFVTFDMVRLFAEPPPATEQI